MNKRLQRIKYAILDTVVDGPHGPRSLGYYASVGMDYFNHQKADPGLYERLGDAAAKAAAEANRKPLPSL